MLRGPYDQIGTVTQTPAHYFFNATASWTSTGITEAILSNYRYITFGIEIGDGRYIAPTTIPVQHLFDYKSTTYQAVVYGVKDDTRRAIIRNNNGTIEYMTENSSWGCLIYLS